jgi:uncharacterized protein (DUF934 family)
MTNIIIRDDGFHADDWTHGYVALADLPSNDDDFLAVDLPSTADARALEARLSAIPLIRVDFPAFNDGRGFTIARLLRAMGYTGRLRARGHVLADQYAMARRAGFDEVEITDTLAARQPESDWLARANWRDHDYRARLRAS